MQVFLMVWNGDLYLFLCFLMCARKYFVLSGTCMGLLINNNEILFCMRVLWCEQGGVLCCINDVYQIHLNVSWLLQFKVKYLFVI